MLACQVGQKRWKPIGHFNSLVIPITSNQCQVLIYPKIIPFHVLSTYQIDNDVAAEGTNDSRAPLWRNYLLCGGLAVYANRTCLN